VKNHLSIAPQGDGTQTWTNTDDETGAVITYQFVPASTLHAGDRIEAMRQFAPGRGNTKNEGTRVLTGPDIADLTSQPGAFVRVKELSFNPGNSQVAQGKAADQT